jgi:hypothetical protein
MTMVYDNRVYEKLQTVDRVVHLLLEDPVVQDRFKELATFDKLGGDTDDAEMLTSQMYQALNHISNYIDGTRYDLSNFLMYMKEFMQLHQDQVNGFTTGSEYAQRLTVIKMNIDNLHFM